jgi:hypothetical protein
MNVLVGFAIVIGAAVVASLTTWILRAILEAIYGLIAGILFLHRWTRILGFILLQAGLLLTTVWIPLGAFDRAIGVGWRYFPDAAQWPGIWAFWLYAAYVVVMWVLGIISGILNWKTASAELEASLRDSS